MIELLVVIAVIALLAAMLLPALTSSKEKGRRTACKSKMHQFYVALQMYADDNKDTFPSGVRDDSQEYVNWVSTATRRSLIDYGGGSANFLFCPNLDLPNLWGAPGGVYSTGYGYVLGYFYLGGHTVPWTSAGGYSSWVSPQKSTDDSKLALIADYNLWCPSDHYTTAPHGSRGAILQGAPYYTPPSSGGPPESIGAAGGHVTAVNGAVVWKPIREMEKHTITPMTTYFLGAW